MKTLQELTGQESGIVIYDKGAYGAEAIICNWSSIEGFPRLDPMGITIMGLGEDIKEVEGEYFKILPYAFGEFFKNEINKEIVILYENGESWPLSGSVYHVEENIVVIAPEGWN